MTGTEVVNTAGIFAGMLVGLQIAKARVELRNPTAAELAAIGQAFQSLEVLFELLQTDQTFVAAVAQ